MPRLLRRFLPLGAVLAGLLLHWPDLVIAQSPAAPIASDSVRRVTLAEALERFERTSLDLRLAREAVAAAEARQISAGARPNPSLSGTREQLGGDERDYHETTLAIGQTLEIGGQRGLRRDAANHFVDAARARLEAERLRLGFEVRRTYLRAAAAETRSGLLAEATEVFRRVERSGQARFAEGDISEFERQRLRVERARYENLLANARLELGDAGRELTLLIAPDSVGSATFLLLPAEPLDGQTGGLTISLDSALLAAAGRADVRAAEAQVEAARAALALQRRERMPDLTLTAGYKDQADGLRGAVIGLSAPLPLLDRNRGGIAEAEAELAAAQTRRDLALRTTEADIRRAWQTYRSLSERIALLNQDLLAESAGLLRTAQIAYAEGEMSLIELLDAADAYRSARESTVEIQAAYLSAIYDLERAMGRAPSIPAPTIAPAAPGLEDRR